MSTRPVVRGLSFTPVKGTRLHRAERLEIGPRGAAGDRTFYLVDETGRMLNGKVLGELSAVVAEATDERLRLTFPGERVVEAAVGDGEPVSTRFYSRTREDRLVEGPFADALSLYLERPVQLVRAQGGAVDRGARGGVSLVSRASIALLAEETEVPEIDARRFRMTIEIDGVGANEEDGWVGRTARIGAATVRFHGHVGRCLITSRDPETGTIDLPTLDVLAGYRGNIESTEPLPLGIYGEVLEPGPVAIGDAVSLAD